MRSAVTVTPAQLPEVLLHVAVVRPMFLWGASGIGKSSLVQRFAADLGLDCVTMLGTQLAPEDLTGVPEVQKAFYSLILDKRIGNYELPKGSVVVGAGNRATDNALARPMASALINRMVHVHLAASVKDWLAWAHEADIHPWVLDYVTQRPDHLWSPAPKTEEPFHPARLAHAVGRAALVPGHQRGDAEGSGVRHADEHSRVDVHRVRQDDQARVRARGRPQGNARWPHAPQDRDLLYFLAEAFRTRLVKELPHDKQHASANGKQLAHRGKALLLELAELSLEIAQMVIAADDDGRLVLPAWFLVEVTRDLPRLVAARA